MLFVLAKINPYSRSKNLREINLDQIRVYQKKMAKEVVIKDIPKNYSNICLLSLVDHSDHLTAGGLVFSPRDFSIKGIFINETVPARYPYVSGMLSLRYKDEFLDILKKINLDYDLIIIFPSAGIQHPRMFGLASEVGLEMMVPTIGITKEALVGVIDSESRINIPPNIECYNVIHESEVVASFLKLSKNVNGIFVSPGHLISVKKAGEIVAEGLEYRLPDPIRYLRKLIRKQIV
jgi:deoxyribonuclease V